MTVSRICKAIAILFVVVAAYKKQCFAFYHIVIVVTVDTLFFWPKILSITRYFVFFSRNHSHSQTTIIRAFPYRYYIY